MNLICIIDIWKILILTWKILILESFLNSGVIFNDSWFWFGIPESILGQVYEILLSCEPLVTFADMAHEPTRIRAESGRISTDPRIRANK